MTKIPTRDPFADLIDDFDGGNNSPIAQVAKQVIEIIDPIVEAAVQAADEAEAYHPTFRETCKKCNGRGRFYGYSGRDFGACRPCQGRGYFERRTAPEVRARAREATVARKPRTVGEYFDAFAAAHPAVWQWINESRERFAFAASMFEAIGKYGDLTEGQLAACERSVAKRDEARQERTQRLESAPTVATDKLMAAFAKASASGLKNPKLRFELFTASPAKATGKNPGAVYLKDGETYLGKIAGGRYVASREASAEQRQAIVSTMADPVAASIAYGRRTGNCACCGRELENKESVERGIGPICFEKYF